jgi:hypothetical protein
MTTCHVYIIVIFKNELLIDDFLAHPCGRKFHALIRNPKQDNPHADPHLHIQVYI